MGQIKFNSIPLLLLCLSILQWPLFGSAGEGFYELDKSTGAQVDLRSVVRIASKLKYDFSGINPEKGPYVDKDGFAVQTWPSLWPINLKSCERKAFASFNYVDVACEHLKQGRDLNEPLAVNYSATGIVVDPNGVILTAAHLIEDCRRLFFRGEYPFNCPLLTTTISVNGQQRSFNGGKILYIGGFGQDSSAGTPDMLDMALIQLPVSTPVIAKLSRGPNIGAKLRALGFPMITKRAEENRIKHKYRDADDSFRISFGSAVSSAPTLKNPNAEGFDPAIYLTADVDAVGGNSGGPVLDGEGRVVGLVARATSAGGPLDEMNVNTEYIINEDNAVWIVRSDAICKRILNIGLLPHVAACRDLLLK